MLVYENKTKGLEAYSLDRDHWNDFVKLFGERGACGGCWCMSWRMKKAEFDANKGEQNKQAMRRLVESGAPIGMLLYDGGQPVGWCAVAPRKEYVRLERSRVFKPIDDQPVWSISCLFIAKSYRRQGLSSELIQAAIHYCKQHGATIIEAYPEVPYDKNVPGAFLWKGIPSVFKNAGFVETVRRSKWKRMMRYQVNE
ncbi:GNAT family N-acetyltransferase [Sporolactobacillus nakayamae]|uniref:Acetyltransferase (GNAT) family protein n=1 Tax=Sporolactobacillus nakayamae TaxID=269670 RepID=A0A1I2MY81_9BACL|nr:GNAT family N-acetyltransferase [Sporolactobacillus nakayamae]SFF96565.1 Acetyltransferase (GNAT) family protein [Sporolactobacillus nakayamae]